jgi:hypothetical protein
VKEFNLKDALAGKPVITRDGRPVKIAGYFGRNGQPYRDVVGWIGTDPDSWDLDGTHFAYGCDSCKDDLFMAPSERKEWVVIYRDNFGNAINSMVYSTHPDFPVPGNTTIHEITIHE